MIIISSPHEGTVFVEVRRRFDAEGLLELQRKVARAYHDLTGAMPPALSRKAVGLDPHAKKEYSSAARQGSKRWHALKVVKGGKR